MVPTFSILMALLVAAPAKPAARDPLLRRGAALFDALDFDGSRASYERALSVRLGSVDEVVEAYLGVGLCDATLGDDAKAKESFLKALALKPDAQLDAADISPRQRAPFDAARAEAGQHGGLRVDHVPPPGFPTAAPVTLTATVVNDWQALVTGARVVFRREGQASWEEVAVTGHSPFTVMLPPMGTGGLEYYVQATDGRGSPVGQWRGPEAPLRSRVGEPDEGGPPLYKRPWVWAVVGGVVAAGIVSGVAATQLQAPDYSVKTRPPP